TSSSDRVTQRSKRGAKLLREKLWLFPGGEVAAAIGRIVVDETGIGAFGPTPRRLNNFTGKCGDGGWNVNISSGREQVAAAFPIETCRRDASARQPIERDIIEHVIARHRAGRVTVDRVAAERR